MWERLVHVWTMEFVSLLQLSIYINLACRPFLPWLQYSFHTGVDCIYIFCLLLSMCNPNTNARTGIFLPHWYTHTHVIYTYHFPHWAHGPWIKSCAALIAIPTAPVASTRELMLKGGWMSACGHINMKIPEHWSYMYMTCPHQRWWLWEKQLCSPNPLENEIQDYWNLSLIPRPLSLAWEWGWNS